MYSDCFLLYICIYKSIFYIFIACIFSHQQLKLVGWGGNLFLIIPPPDHCFLVPVGRWFQGIISVASFIFYHKCSSLILFFFIYIAQLSLLSLVLLLIHSGCQTKAGGMLMILDKHLYSNTAFVPGFWHDLCLTFLFGEGEQ